MDRTFSQARDYAVSIVGYGRTKDKIDGLVEDGLRPAEIAGILFRWAQYQASK